MIRILLFGISMITLLACQEQTSRSIAVFDEIVFCEVKSFSKDYAKYCELIATNETNVTPVQYSFVGNHKSAIELNAKRNYDFFALRSINKKMNFKTHRNSSDSIIYEDAKKSILKIADKYHFTLINEAHHSSQNRVFTASLLKTLWEKGYRYLALEALGYNDNGINDRMYPTTRSGYYIKESSFGNMIREAKKIGYKLISYETRLNNDGTERDYEQAKNIFNQTLKIDSKGKVLIHAGYSHISEDGGEEYKPLGMQLKHIISQDILTIDQVEMSGYVENFNVNKFYSEILYKHKIKFPIVLKKGKDDYLVDAINESGIDIQVYHPEPQYINGRPNWLITSNTNNYNLPKKFNKYIGCLIQVVPVDELVNAIPIDQFILDEKDKSIIVPLGFYSIRIINCQGTLIGKCDVEIK